MSNPSIQGGSDGTKHEPATQEKCAPFCPNSLNEHSSEDGTHRLGSPRYPLHSAAHATTHGIRGCHEPIGIKRNRVDRGNQFFCCCYQPYHNGIGRDCVERKHQGFEPEHTNRNCSKPEVLTHPVACQVPQKSTHSRCRKDGTNATG